MPDPEQVFDEAARIPVRAEREAFVAGVCKGDPQVLELVRAMLDQHATPGSWIDGVAAVPADGPTTPAPPGAAPAGGPPPRPDRIGQFEVLGVIAAGAFGTVYHARDPELGNDWAIKVLTAGPEADQTTQDRFAREARTAASIHHPNVIPIILVGTAPGVGAYMVMKWFPGGSLGAFLESGPLPVPVFLPVALGVACGLQAAHGRKTAAGEPDPVIHRDIKPANILLEFAEGRVTRAVLADFGLARPVTAATLSAPMTVLGTLAYMSLEAFNGVSDDPRSDLFSLGVVFYEMLTGSNPFAGRTTAAGVVLHMDKSGVELPHLAAACPGVPPALAALVHRLLAVHPADRVQSAAEVVTTLESLMNPPPPPPPPPPWWLLPLCVAALLVAVVWGGLLLAAAPKTPLQQAFEAYDAGDYDAALAIADRETRKSWTLAKKRQDDLTEKKVPEPPDGVVDDATAEKIHLDGPLNDTGSLLWVHGESALELGQVEAAKASFKKSAELRHARCWDPKGWFWNPAEKSKLTLDALDTGGTSRSKKAGPSAVRAALRHWQWGGVGLFAVVGVAAGAGFAVRRSRRPAA